MNREMEQRRMRAEAFRVNNGKVMLYINLLREQYNKLQNVEKCMKKDGITRREFLDCINFLNKANYITLRTIDTRQRVELADVDYTELEGQATEKGIRLLNQEIKDALVDLEFED